MSADNDSAIDIAAVGADRLDDLRELWLALHQHHGEIGSRPLVADEALSWERRRAQYEAWLAADDAFVLLAEREGEPIGYAFVRLHDGPDDTYPLGERYAEIHSLAVAPAYRGQGIGGQLMDDIEWRLAVLGITDITLSAMVENASALRFYARRGFVAREIVFYRFG